MSISTLKLLRRLYVAGVDVELNDLGGLRLTGHTPPQDLLDKLVADKDDVLTLLQEQRVGTRTLAWGAASPAATRHLQDVLPHGRVPASGPVAASSRTALATRRTKEKADEHA